MEEGAETSEEEWQHHGGLATSWRTGNIKGGVETSKEG